MRVNSFLTTVRVYLSAEVLGGGIGGPSGTSPCQTKNSYILQS